MLLAALALGIHAGWLPAKAVLAQHLLQTSWTQGLADGATHRPWPWADTHPVARLLQPRLGIDQIVLAGDSGRPLAFGPGWAEASARPGSGAGTTIISGHRDTHFSWLRELRGGDTLRLESERGPRDYRVASLEVVDSRQHRIAAHAGDEQLVLVTCWPFDATAPRGPMRYVVTLARVEGKALATDDRGREPIKAARSQWETSWLVPALTGEADEDESKPWAQADGGDRAWGFLMPSRPAAARPVAKRQRRISWY